MKESLKALAVCGSLRSGSYNRVLLRIAREYARSVGAAVEEADLRSLALPLYDGDIEAAGFPAQVEQLKEMVRRCDALLIACPEYNYSMSGPLKNMIDWVSRGGNAFKGKVAAIFGASTGPYGTLRAQNQLRLCLTCVDVLVLPQPQVMIARAAEAFDEDGSLRDGKHNELLQRLVERTLETAARLKAEPVGAAG